MLGKLGKLGISECHYAFDRALLSPLQALFEASPHDASPTIHSPTLGQGQPHLGALGMGGVLRLCLA